MHLKIAIVIGFLFMADSLHGAEISRKLRDSPSNGYPAGQSLAVTPSSPSGTGTAQAGSQTPATGQAGTQAPTTADTVIGILSGAPGPAGSTPQPGGAADSALGAHSSVPPQPGSSAQPQVGTSAQPSSSQPGTSAQPGSSPQPGTSEQPGSTSVPLAQSSDKQPGTSAAPGSVPSSSGSQPNQNGQPENSGAQARPPTSTTGRVRKVIIDTDVGIDDACALILAFSRPEFDIIALTTVAGNVPLRQATANANRIKRLVGREDLPIYRGADRALISTLIEKPEMALNIHGNDGLGDSPTAAPAALKSDFTNVVPNKHAALAIVELAKTNPGLTLIAIGPLTNVALAIKLDPNLSSNVEHLWVMGGNIRAKGNVQMWETAEFNFNGDPEAANIVFNEFGGPITALPWEMYFDYPATKEFAQQYTNKVNTARGKFLNAIMSKGYLTVNERYGFADEMAVSVAIDQSIILESINLYSTVELSGRFTRGQVAIDYMNSTHKAVNVQLVSKVDTPKAEQLLLKSLDDTPSRRKHARAH